MVSISIKKIINGFQNALSAFHAITSPQSNLKQSFVEIIFVDAVTTGMSTTQDISPNPKQIRTIPLIVNI